MTLKEKGNNMNGYNKDEVIEIDNKEYYVIETLTLNNNKYIYLGNLNDPKDLMCLKEVYLNEELLLEKLDSEEELEQVMRSFSEILLNDKHEN